MKVICGDIKFGLLLRCGTLNPDTAVNCSNCGAPLSGSENRPYSRFERRRYYRENYGYSRGGDGGIGLLIIGLFIILIELAAFAGFTAFWNYFWPIVLVLVGVWILVVGCDTTADITKLRHLNSFVCTEFNF